MSLRRRAGATAAAAALSVGAAACGDDGDGGAAESAAGQGAAVTIDTFIFSPDPLEVDAGTMVAFTNRDDILHTVTEGARDEPVEGGFDLQLDGPGASGEVGFDRPGTIRYVCTIHAGMDGTVVVR